MGEQQQKGLKKKDSSTNQKCWQLCSGAVFGLAKFANKFA